MIEPLSLNSVSACQEIQALLRSKLHDLGKDGILIGLSGGLDSAVVAYLSVRALGREKVHLLNMPDRDSKPLHVLLRALTMRAHVPRRAGGALSPAAGATATASTRDPRWNKLRERSGCMSTSVARVVVSAFRSV